MRRQRSSTSPVPSDTPLSFLPGLSPQLPRRSLFGAASSAFADLLVFIVIFYRSHEPSSRMYDPLVQPYTLSRVLIAQRPPRRHHIPLSKDFRFRSAPHLNRCLLVADKLRNTATKLHSVKSWHSAILHCTTDTLRLRDHHGKRALRLR
jgi:hypothetical protein